MHLLSKNQITSPLLSPTGEVIYELVGLAEASGRAQKHSLAHICLPPGKASAPHYHKLSEETYYVLSGLAHLRVDEREFDMQPGQALLIEPGEVHQVSNLTGEDMHFLAVCAPPWEPSDSVYG